MVLLDWEFGDRLLRGFRIHVSTQETKDRNRGPIETTTDPPSSFSSSPKFYELVALLVGRAGHFHAFLLHVKEILNPESTVGAPSWVYYSVYEFFVFLFNIFDIANLPKEIADYLNKMGARIPNIKPGKATIERTTVEVGSIIELRRSYHAYNVMPSLSKALKILGVQILRREKKSRDSCVSLSLSLWRYRRRDVETTEDHWPQRRDVVTCACVLKKWREITGRSLDHREIVRSPRNSGKITFPSCLKLKAAYEEKYIVIMAGDDLPTYLATPAGNKCVCSHEGEVVILEEGDAAKREENKQNERSSTVAWRRPRRLEKTKQVA
uniref:Uncharacterized protein n=1 Tax=Brassica oleracea var. oleracea TaxID=109376 RepID=A0A0D3BRP6_BRAOL